MTTFENAGTWCLPCLGSDWLKGFTDHYILVNPVFSIGGKTAFYTGKKEITGNFFDAGVIPGEKVRSKLFFYNDGLMMVAVPLTFTALRILSTIDTSDATAWDVFANTWACLLQLPVSSPGL